MIHRPSPAAQDYLKALLMLKWEAAERGDDGSVTTPTKALAERLEVSAASATNMLKRLDEMGLIRHSRYRGAELTAAGEKVALEVIRHHRLLETYLAEALGVPWDEVHAEAEVLEHVLSENLEDRIAALLGDPSFDPHGHPIPGRDGSLPRASERRLWQVQAGEKVAIDRVSDQISAALRELDRVGIRPGAGVEVVSKGPVGGPLFVRVEGSSDEVTPLSRELAEAVWVQ